MIKNEDKIKSAEQLLNIVFDNDSRKINKFYEDFELISEGAFIEESFLWGCTFKSRHSQSEIENIFSDNTNGKKLYSGDITGYECDDYDYCDDDIHRGCVILSILDKKNELKQTFYKKVKDNFLRLVELISKAELEDKEMYDNQCLERFGHTSNELTEEEIDELDNEEYCKWLSDEGWIDED